MDRQPTLLDDIYTGEVEDVTFPCGTSLKAGEAITLVQITCARYQGAADANAAAVVATPHQVIGNDVVQRLAGHKAGVWYLLRAEVTLNSGRVLVGLGLIYSKDR